MQRSAGVAGPAKPPAAARRAGGTGWIWLSGAALALALLIGAGLIGFITVNGLAHFWPAPVEELELADGSRLLGEVLARERIPASRLREAGVPLENEAGTVLRTLYRLGSAEGAGARFVWLREDEIRQRSRPVAVFVLQRQSGGPLFGQLVALEAGERSGTAPRKPAAQLQALLSELDALRASIHRLEQRELLPVQRRILALEARSGRDEDRARLVEARQLEAELLARRQALREQAAGPRLWWADAQGAVHELALEAVLHATQPNAMGLAGKLREAMSRMAVFLSGFPREANTEGGILPALFGTVAMVLVMSVLVAPIGVVTAVYLSEYASDGPLLRGVRASIYALAGVPSIVFGIVGLGLFVYVAGGSLDALLFSDRLPEPTFGTPGLFWAALTLALLTLPVVVASTEEGLARIPTSLREGAIALGATRWETLSRVLLPLAAPAMMTGLILAIARAAGEVAPLMLVGVVKLAPALPIDSEFPFLHLDRKFMHLGYHIYDAGFQSAQSELARGLVHATALVLVSLVLLLNLAAFAIRHHLRERFRGESL